MPQAFSPTRPTLTIPGRSPRASNHVSPRSPRARDPQYWDTETISAHIEREVPKDKSPLLVKLVKDKQVDGHTILGTPPDVLERGLGLGDTELARDFMSVVDRMRGKTVLPPSPRRKYQSLVEIVEKLKELPSPGETSPMGNTTPELAPATAASPPPTPSDWDYDDEPSNGPNTHPFPYPIQTQGRFIGWSRDSTMYAPLLHPYAPSSPESAHMLSAIHVPRPLRASTSSLATHLEEVSSVVDHGDHHGPTHDAQSHDDLLGRAAAPMNQRQVSTESDHPRLSRDEHIRTQLPRLRGRSRSCPPEGPTRHVQPPHTSQELPAPPLRRPTPPPPRQYEDVAIQTENFVDVEVQTDIVDWRSTQQDTTAQTSAVAQPSATETVSATQEIAPIRTTDIPSNTADVATTGAEKELVNSPVDLAETKVSPQATSTQNASSDSPQAGPSTVEKPPAAQDAASPQPHTTTTSGGGASKAKETDPIESTQHSASTPDATSTTARSAKKPPVSRKNTSQTAQDKVSNSTAANSEQAKGTQKSTPPTPKNATPPTTGQNSSSGTKAKGQPKNSAPATPSTTKAAEEQPSTPVDTKAVKAARSEQGAVESSRDTTVVKEKTPKPESKPEEYKISASSAPAPAIAEKSAKAAPDSSAPGVDDTTSSTGATSGRDGQMLVLASDQTTKTTTDQTAVKESKSTLKDVPNDSPVVAEAQSSSDVNIEMKGITAKQQSSGAQSEGAARSEPPPTPSSGPSPPEPTTTSANASSPEIPGAFPNITTSTTATTTQSAPKATRNAWGSANKGLKLDTSGKGVKHDPVQATLPLGRSSTLSSATANRSGPAPLPPPPQGGQSHLRSASMHDGGATQSLFTPPSGANGGSNGNGGRLGMDRSASSSFSGSSFGRAGGTQGTPGGGQSADTFRGPYLVQPPVASSTQPPQRSFGFGLHAGEKPKPASPGWFSAVTNAVSGFVSPASAPTTPSPVATESPTRSSSLPPNAAGGRGQRVDTDYYATSLERNQSPLNHGVSSFVPTSRGGSSGGSTAGPTIPSASASKWASKPRQSQASTEGSRTATKPSSPVVEPRATPTAQSGSASDDPIPHTTTVGFPDPVTNEPKQSVDIVENKEPASKPLDTDALSPTVASPEKEKESGAAGPVDVVSSTPAANAASSSDAPLSSKVTNTDSLVLAPQGESSTAGAPKEADKTNDASSTVDPSKEADKTSDASAASAVAKDKELPPNPPSSESVKQTALTETTEVQDPASQPDASSVAVVEPQGSVHEDANDATKAAPTTSTSTDQDTAPQLSVDTVLADSTSSPPPPVADAAQLNSEEASWSRIEHQEANVADAVVLAEPSQKPEESGGEVHAAEEQSHETEGFVDVGASTGKPPLPKLDTALTLDAGTTQTEGSTPAVETTTPLPSNFKVLTDDEYNSMTAKFRRIYRADYQNAFNKAYVIPPKPKLPVARK